MKRARRFLSPNKDGIYFSKDGKYIIIIIKNVCLPALLIGLERKSLIEVLKDLNSLRPIKAAFSSFGLNLKKCFENNPEATLRVMRERCQEEIEREKSRGYTSSVNLADWRSVLKSAGKNPPEELRQLLGNTIAELEKIGIKKPPRKRKPKKSEVYYRFR